MKKIPLLIASAFIINPVHVISAQAANESKTILPVVPTTTAPTYVILPTDPNLNIEYYAEKDTYPYVYYGGYFWYPKADATVLNEYTPAYWNGYYWYASRVHPHQVYIEKQDALYLVPITPTGILE